MSDSSMFDISDIVWNQKKMIKKIKKNKNLNRYIYFSHLVILLCTLIYGAILGFYAKNIQILFNSIKIPLLFFITLYITAPVVFIVDVLQENKVSFKQVIVLLLLGFNNTGIVLLAFTPLMLFFILTTLDYSFIVMLNIAICGFAGYFGLISMYTNFNKFHDTNTWKPALNIGGFLIIFVGTQLAWTLRPFFNTYSEFVKPVSSNFYIALGSMLSQNPEVAFILFGVFALIAIIITVNRFADEASTTTSPSWPGQGYSPTNQVGKSTINQNEPFYTHPVQPDTKFGTNIIPEPTSPEDQKTISSNPSIDSQTTQSSIPQFHVYPTHHNIIPIQQNQMQSQ